MNVFQYSSVVLRICDHTRWVDGVVVVVVVIYQCSSILTDFSHNQHILSFIVSRLFPCLNFLFYILALRFI